MRKLRLELNGADPMVFDGALVTIGRSSSNLLVIADHRISSVHGEIVRRGGAFFYRDLGSTNGSLVRSGGTEIVIDGKQVREVELSAGDELLLGDRKEPVIVLVTPIEVEGKPTGQTIVGRRVLTTAQALGTQVMENPLANRQTLSRLLQFYAEVSRTKRPRDATDITCALVLDLLSRIVFVSAFLRTPNGEERVSLVTRDAAHFPIISNEELNIWFPDVFAGEAALVVDVRNQGKRRFGDLERLAAAPIPGLEEVCGVLLIGRKADLSDFDLDLVSLVAHHCGIQLVKLGLIEQLSQANLKLSTENRDLREQLTTANDIPAIIGESHNLTQALKQAKVVAKTDTTVLILGETGTGKELIARYVHDNSPRVGARFAAVNCGALVETLLESELFGHVKGAFTGADRDKKGLFRLADGGTLFLDEIGDVSPGLQVKLLRALEEGEVIPVGAGQPIHVDVRIIAATHRDLDQEVASGRFREDLLYRVNVFPIQLPPLRDRAGDIGILLHHFLGKFSEILCKSPEPFSSDALSRLEGYHWPGNIRELQNEVHRAVLLCEDNQPIGCEYLSERVRGATEVPTEIGPLKEMMGRVEERYIRRVLKEHGDNRTAAAKSLGISRQALTEKLRKYHIGPRYAGSDA